jgi:hypothetical protein
MPGTKRKIAIFLFLSAFIFHGFAWKKEAHMIMLLPIDGCGIYSSVRVLQDSHSTATIAPAVMNLSLLGANAAIGCFAIFGAQPNYPKLRRIHRYVGFAVTAAALWMSIAAGNDELVENSDRTIAHAYTISTAIPLIALAF